MISKETFINSINKIDTGRVYVQPNIPEKKIDSAISSYARSVCPSDVVVLGDDTVFGGSKEGFILTAECFYSKMLGSNPLKCSFKEIKSIFLDKKEIIINDNIFFSFNIIDREIMENVCEIIKDHILKSSEVGNRSQDAHPNFNVDDTEGDLAENSFFFGYKKTFLLSLEEGGMNRKNMLFFYKLYNNFLAIASEYKMSDFFCSEALRLMYDDHVVYQSYIFTLFNATQMLSDHLGRDGTVKVLSPLELIPIAYAKLNHNSVSKTLAEAINPNNFIADSEEIDKLRESMKYYFMAHKPYIDNVEISEGYRTQKVIDYFTSITGEKIHERYRHDGSQILELCSKKEKDVDAYILDYGQLSRTNTEKILIEYFTQK